MFWDWSALFASSATPLTMTLKQFIPHQKHRYHNRENEEFVTTKTPTTLFMTALTNTIFNSHWVLEQFSYEYRKTNTKIITPTNHNMSRQRNEWIRIPSNLPVTCSRLVNDHAYKLQLLLVLLIIGWKTEALFLSQSLRVAIAIT